MGFLRWLKTIIHIKGKEQEIPTIAELRKEDNYETVEYHPNPKVEEESKKLGEYAKQQFLPVPKSKRVTCTYTYVPPAERHRDSISKFMKGKASNRYLKTIKQSPKIKIEEDN